MVTEHRHQIGETEYTDLPPGVYPDSRIYAIVEIDFGEGKTVRGLCYRVPSRGCGCFTATCEPLPRKENGQ
jgi:hypothetical protein